MRKYVIADEVAVLVVDFLELVEIRHDHTQGCIVLSVRTRVSE